MNIQFGNVHSFSATIWKTHLNLLRAGERSAMRGNKTLWIHLESFGSFGKHKSHEVEVWYILRGWKLRLSDSSIGNLWVMAKKTHRRGGGKREHWQVESFDNIWRHSLNKIRLNYTRYMKPILPEFRFNPIASRNLHHPRALRKWHPFHILNLRSSFWYDSIIQT